jgi:cytochrome c553
MNNIARNLSKQDAAAVAAYFDQLPIPIVAPEPIHGKSQETSLAIATSRSR